MMSNNINFQSFCNLANLCLLAGYQQQDSADERYSSGDGREGYGVCFVAGCVDRSDVNDFLPGRIGKTSPRETDETERNQDDSKRFVHSGLLWCDPTQSIEHLEGHLAAMISSR
jgi:hypothetical protein